MEEFVPDDEAIRNALSSFKEIVVVGLSDNPARPSHDVATYLRRVGYGIVPVNPMLTTWEGLQAFPSIQAAKQAGRNVGFVDVFRRSEEVGAVVDDAIAAGSKVLWLQLGVISEVAARRATEAGLLVVMDRCSKIEHRRLVR